jgi:hypothetical protein
MEWDVLTEQRTNIKFLVKLGKTGWEILEMLETVYGESAMKCSTVYKWVDRFKEGQESVALQHHVLVKTFNVFMILWCHTVALSLK